MYLVPVYSLFLNDQGRLHAGQELCYAQEDSFKQGERNDEIYTPLYDINVYPTSFFPDGDQISGGESEVAAGAFHQ